MRPQLPFTCKAAADHLAKVAAPETGLEFQIFGRLAVQDLLQHVDRGLTQVEAATVVIPGNTNGFLRVRAHHVSKGCAGAFGELRFSSHTLSLTVPPSDRKRCAMYLKDYWAYGLRGVG